MEKCGEKDTNRKQLSSRLKKGLELEFFSMEWNKKKKHKQNHRKHSLHKPQVRVSYPATSLRPVFVVSL